MLGGGATYASAHWSTGPKTARGVRMEERVTADPLDADAWVVLLAEAAEQSPADYRPLYERCVSHFPSAACVWYQWLEAELRGRHLEQMEAIFERCLLHCPHVELWRLYLRFLRDMKGCAAKEIQSAYEVLLEAVGQDVGAGQLWVDFVSILTQAVEPGSMPMSGAVTAARDAYQRALVQPAMGLEAMWKDYELWETAQSGPQAKALLGEIADRALVARRVARERQARAAPLKLNRMPRVPRGTEAEFTELGNWRAMWTYEATNPQRLAPLDLRARMHFVFNQALMICYFTPQVWHEAAVWMHDHGHTQAAQSFYTRALETLPGNEVLTLASARLEEAEGNAAAREILERLVTLKPTPLCYIHLMRLVRRLEGASAARQVFARARRAEGCTWHVYAAAAQLEHQMGGRADGVDAEEDEEDGGVVAARILALALDRFEDEAPLALHCVDFLVQRNDATNARAVLERTLQTERGAGSKELWAAYVRLESVFGSAASLKAVEERRGLALSNANTSSLYQLAAMHSFHDLWPANERELRGLAEETKVAEAAEEGAADAAAKPTTPNLALLTEYTGEPILLDTPAPASGAAGGAVAADSSMARAVPYQIDALLEALPSRLIGAGALEKVDTADVARLFERLSRLPERLADLPAAAAALPGGAWGAAPTDAAAAPKRPRGVDAFTARQRKKQQVMGQA